MSVWNRYTFFDYHVALVNAPHNQLIQYTVFIFVWSETRIDVSPREKRKREKKRKITNDIRKFIKECNGSREISYM